ATITVVPPSSTGASGGYSGSPIATIAGGTAAEREAALRRISGAPGASGSTGTSALDEPAGSIGTVGAPPNGGGNLRFPGEPGDPNSSLNPEGFVPATVEEDLPIAGLPGASGRNKHKDEQ